MTSEPSHIAPSPKPNPSRPRKNTPSQAQNPVQSLSDVLRSLPCPERQTNDRSPYKTVKLTNLIIASAHKPQLEVPICAGPVRRKQTPTTARISLQCIHDVKEHTKPTTNPSRAPIPKRVPTSAIPWSQSAPPPLPHRRRPTVEWGFSDSLRRVQALF